MSPLPAYILAGGKSSRFGSDKALYEHGGIPLWRRVATALAGAGCTVHVMCRSPRGLPLPEVIEPDGPSHPLWGVLHALLHARDSGNESVVVAPCDLVDLTADAVATLIAASRRTPSRGDHLGQVHAKGQPLLAVTTTDSESWCRRCAQQGESVQLFQVATRSVEINVGELTNLNQRPRG